MRQFVVMYVRITDDKREGITFGGPWVGATECNTEAAEEEVAKLVRESKGSAVIAKIFELFDGKYDDMRNKAILYFNRIETEMNESKEMLERPATRRKKKKSINTS